MAGRDVFETFAGSLRKGLGTPNGLTEQEVARGLNGIYSDLNSAIAQYDKLLKYQSEDLSISSGLTKIDRVGYSAIYAITVGAGEQSIQMPVNVDREGIQATTGYLATANVDGQGTWPVSELNDFIERLGFAILHALGIKP